MPTPASAMSEEPKPGDPDPGSVADIMYNNGGLYGCRKEGRRNRGPPHGCTDSWCDGRRLGGLVNRQERAVLPAWEVGWQVADLMVAQIELQLLSYRTRAVEHRSTVTSRDRLEAK